MNKQEVIEEIKKLSIEKNGISHDKGNIDGIGLKDKITTWDVIRLLKKLDEPQKVVIPQFVAEWIEKCKDMNCSLRDAMKNIKLSAELNAWFLKTGQDMFTYPNQEIFARAWLDGYEIEQEKLYIVKIADAILAKITGVNNVQYKFLNFADISEVSERTIYTAKLTEQEIKQKDERLWQFAKEVE